MSVVDDALNEIIENKFNHKNLPAFIDNLGVPFEQLEQILLKLVRLHANESILYKFIERNFFEFINREELKLIEDPVLRRLYVKAIQEKLAEDAFVYFTTKIIAQLSKIQTEYKEVKFLIINTPYGNVWKLAKLTSVGVTLILTKEASSILLKILLMQGDFTGIKLKGNKDKFFKDIITSLTMNNNANKLRPFVLLNILDKFGPTDQKLEHFLEIFKSVDSPKAKKNVRLLKFLLSKLISKRRKLVKKFIMEYNGKNEQTQTGQCSAE